jgi:hypothetical protein
MGLTSNDAEAAPFHGMIAMNKVSMAFALAVLLASGAAMAQSAGSDGGKGDNSETTFCRNRLEQAQLRAQSMTDGSKQGELAKALQNAREAMSSGNSTKCLVELNRVGS